MASFVLAIIACFALTCCILAGCGSSGSGSSGSTVKVTDAYGRTVEVPKDVKTAATVGSGARIVAYAGGIDKLIAVTEMDTNTSPLRPYTVVYADTFASLPTTSNGNHLNETTVDTERMVELAPDVIISSRSAEECNQLQESVHIPVIGVKYQDEIFSKDLNASIEVVGKVLGTSDHAAKVIKKLEEWQADLANRTKGINDDQKPSVYVGSVNYKGAKGFTGTYAAFSVFQAVSINNVADQTGNKGWFETDLEQVGAWDPDFIFLNSANKAMLEEEYSNNQAFFDGLKAMQNGKLYSLPAFNMNGTNIDLGVCSAYYSGATVYGERFADLNLTEKYNEIFETLLGKPCYEELAAKGIAFGPMTLGAGA